MNVQSLAFLAFLTVTVCVCRLLPKERTWVLLAASLVFYLWGGAPAALWGCGLLAVSSFVSYLAANTLRKHRRKSVLLAVVCYHIAVLGIFKYTVFFTGGAVRMPFVPLGISFFTFQQIWYLREVYAGTFSQVPTPAEYLTYSFFFPTVSSGPILKPENFFPQLREASPLPQDTAAGLYAIGLGLAKKVLLADAIGALWTDIIGVADSPSTTFVGLANASTPLVWLGIIAYSLQLYFDFSGYSMMGIGMGKMLGFDFPANFNYPYISASITEFWRRWHMTLSGWFREYVYIPLGGNRKGLKRQIFNLFVVELLTGIWHGANWNFICWGLYYFVLLAIEKLFLLPHLKKGKVWPHIYTLFLVVVGWAMFVGNDTGVSFGLLFQKLFIPSGGVSPLYFLRNYGVLLAVSILCCTPLIEKLWDVLRRNVVTRCAAILTLLVISTAYVVGSTNSPFLYFNF